MGDDVIKMTVVLLLFGPLAVFFISITPIGKALAARILGKKLAGDNEESMADVNELRREVDELRHLPEQMSELGERVDFLERMVAKQREAERLPPVR
jgi:C4-dicarboxylate-specific signal transduction histidine kinase